MKQKSSCSIEKEEVVLFDPQNVEKLREIRKKTLEELSDGLWLHEERMADFLACEYISKVWNLPISYDEIIDFFALIEAIEDQKDHYSAGDLSEALGIRAPKIQSILRKVGLEALHDNDTMRQAVEWGIDKGMGLGNIAEKTPWTQQYISLYLNHRPEMKKRWKKNKKQRREQRKELARQRPEALQKLLSLVRHKAEQRAQTDFALAKATEYLRKTPFAQYPFTKLAQFFDYYQKSKDLTLNQLGEPYGIQASNVRRILQKVDLKHHGRILELLPKEKVDAVKKGAKYGFSNQDIAYFLRIRPSTTCHTYQGSIKKERKGKLVSTDDGTCMRSNYSRISKVLEAIASEFNDAEILEYAQVNQHLLEKVHDHKEELTDNIVRGLRILYDNPKITKPYPSEQCVFGDPPTTK